MSEQPKVMKSASITLTEAEANNLMELLNIATKAGGMSVARNALFFWEKFSRAFNLKEKQVEAPKEKVKIKK